MYPDRADTYGTPIKKRTGFAISNTQGLVTAYQRLRYS